MLENTLLNTKKYLYTSTRLLERKFFEFFFEDGSVNHCLQALKAYQNDDNGFGNGLELDLLCPDSSAIGAETALYYLDLLDFPNKKILQQIMSWVKQNQTENGIIIHPPEGLHNYPHQPWWEKPDNTRVFSILGYLAKAGITDNKVTMKAKAYLKQKDLTKELTFYDYPFILFLSFLGDAVEEKKLLEKLLSRVPTILNDNTKHFPLISRYWYHLIYHQEKEVFVSEAKRFLDSIEPDGGMPIIYQDLPWWRPIFTLDGLMITKKYKLQEFFIK